MNNPPDLRVLASLIAVKLGLPAADIKRLRECPEHSLSLVMLRVCMSELKRRNLLSTKQEDAMLAEATPKLDPATLMYPVGENVKLGTVVTVEQIIHGIDVALSSPTTRARFEPWFIKDFWPAVMQRMATGDAMSEREQSIARRVLAEVTA